MPYADLGKQKQYWKDYAKRNQEKIKSYKRGWYEANREKHAEYMRRRRAKNPERYREYFAAVHRRKAYGLSDERFSELVAQQNGGCAICGHVPTGRGRWDRRLNVDHCHNGEGVRGLLCGPCNRAIGLLGDSADRLEKALVYLRRFEQKED